MIKQNTWKEIKALKTQLEVTILLIRVYEQPQVKPNPPTAPDLPRAAARLREENQFSAAPAASTKSPRQNSGQRLSRYLAGAMPSIRLRFFPPFLKKAGEEDPKLPNLTPDTGSYACRPAAVHRRLRNVVFKTQQVFLP